MEGKPARKPKWRPRASQLGYYMTCTYRAAFDRALYEGALDVGPEVLSAVEEKKKSSPNADLGTCIHYHLQAGLNCIFPGKTEEHAPTTEQRINASALFNGNLERLDTAVRNCAILAARHMPKLPDGVRWHAESLVKTKGYSGHIDFLSPEAGIIADLKTTSRPPLHPYIKPAHLVQLLAYVDAVETISQGRIKLASGVVLYVDATSAGWAMPIEIDLTTDAVAEYRAAIVGFAALCASKKLYQIAIPQIGAVCEEWCPYTSVCRDRFQSKHGTLHKAGMPGMKGLAL